MILGFKDFKFKYLKFLSNIGLFINESFLDSLYYNIFAIDKIYGFKRPFFFIKTKRNYEIVLEYGKIETEQNEVNSENS